MQEMPTTPPLPRPHRIISKNINFFQASATDWRRPSIPLQQKQKKMVRPKVHTYNSHGCPACYLTLPVCCHRQMSAVQVLTDNKVCYWILRLARSCSTFAIVKLRFTRGNGLHTTFTNLNPFFRSDGWPHEILFTVQ